MLLQHQTWQEVETYLAQSKGIILPIGSTEQHGPNGLIGTDAICAEVIAKAVGEAADCMVGPTIGVGIAVHHMGFAGTMTVRPSTLIAVMRDYVLSLARHGFRKFLFINGHGGNIATIQAAFSEIYAEFEGAIGLRRDGDELRCRLANWWDGKATGRFHGPADYRRRFPDGRIGSNPGLATPEKGQRFFETSVAELTKTYTAFMGENA